MTGPEATVPTRRTYWGTKGLEMLDTYDWMNREDWIVRVSRLVPAGIALREGQRIRALKDAERVRRQDALQAPHKAHRGPEPTREDLIRRGGRSKATKALGTLRDSGRLEERVDPGTNTYFLRRRAAWGPEPMDRHEMAVTCKALETATGSLKAAEMRRFVAGVRKLLDA